MKVPSNSPDFILEGGIYGRTAFWFKELKSCPQWPKETQLFELVLFEDETIGYTGTYFSIQCHDSVQHAYKNWLAESFLLKGE